MGGTIISYSPKSDAVYIQLTDSEVAHTKIVDDARIIDYDANWQVVGVELLGAPAGLDLPEHQRLELEARVLNFPVLV